MNRFTTLKEFKNYASENCSGYWECDEKDIDRAWLYYNSEEGKYNEFSVHYCIDVSLEVKHLVF
jgi:hypothetical protein